MRVVIFVLVAIFGFILGLRYLFTDLSFIGIIILLLSLCLLALLSVREKQIDTNHLLAQINSNLKNSSDKNSSKTN